MTKTKKEMKDAVAETLKKSDFFFVVTGKKNKDGSISSTQAVQGILGDLTKIISHAFKDYSELEQAIFSIRLSEKIGDFIKKMKETND